MPNDEVTFANRDHHQYTLHVGRYCVVRLALRSDYNASVARLGVKGTHGVRVMSADQLMRSLDLSGLEGCWSVIDNGPYYLITDFLGTDPQSIGILQSVRRKRG